MPKSRHWDGPLHLPPNWLCSGSHDWQVIFATLWNVASGRMDVKKSVLTRAGVCIASLHKRKHAIITICIAIDLQVWQTEQAVGPQLHLQMQLLVSLSQLLRA